MTAGIAEVFADGCTGKRCVVLQGGRIAGRCGHDDGIVHGTILAQGIDDGGNGRTFLTDGYVDTVHGIARFVVGPLVDDGIDGNGCFSCLAVADNQLTLSAADRNHGVYCLQARLQRLVDWLPEDDAGCFALQRHFTELAAYQAFAVEGYAQRVDDTPQHTFAHHNGSDTLGTLHGEPFLDFVGRSQ